MGHRYNQDQIIPPRTFTMQEPENEEDEEEEDEDENVFVPPRSWLRDDNSPTEPFVFEDPPEPLFDEEDMKQFDVLAAQPPWVGRDPATLTIPHQYPSAAIIRDIVDDPDHRQNLRRHINTLHVDAETDDDDDDTKTGDDDTPREHRRRNLDAFIGEVGGVKALRLLSKDDPPPAYLNSAMSSDGMQGSWNIYDPTGTKYGTNVADTNTKLKQGGIAGLDLKSHANMLSAGFNTFPAGISEVLDEAMKPHTSPIPLDLIRLIAGMVERHYVVVTFSALALALHATRNSHARGETHLIQVVFLMSQVGQQLRTASDDDGEGPVRFGIGHCVFISPKPHRQYHVTQPQYTTYAALNNYFIPQNKKVVDADYDRCYNLKVGRTYLLAQLHSTIGGWCPVSLTDPDGNLTPDLEKTSDVYDAHGSKVTSCKTTNTLAVYLRDSHATPDMIIGLGLHRQWAFNGKHLESIPVRPLNLHPHPVLGEATRQRGTEMLLQGDRMVVSDSFFHGNMDKITKTMEQLRLSRGL